MSKSNVSQSATEVPMLPRAIVPANPMLPPAEHAVRTLPGQAIDPSHCPVDHAVRGLGPKYLSAAPTASTHFPDGTMNYEGFFRQQLHDLLREGNYRVFCNLERQAGNFPYATHFSDRGQSTVTIWCSNDYLAMAAHPSVMAAMHEAVERCGAGAGAGTSRARPTTTCC